MFIHQRHFKINFKSEFKTLDAFLKKTRIVYI